MSDSISIEEAERLLRELTTKVALILDEKAFEDAFGFTLEEYVKKREDFADICRNHATHIKQITRKTGIARTAGGGVGIASGVIGIIGLCLIPVTFGGSIGLTVISAVAGVGSASTTLTATIVKDKKIKADYKQINDARDQFEMQETVLAKLFEDLNKYQKRLQEILSKCPDALLRFSEIAVGAFKLSYSIVWKAIDVTVNLVQIVAAAIIADFNALRGIAAGMTGLKFIKWTIVAAGSVAGKAVCGVLSAISIGVGIFDVVKGSKDIKGSETADKITEFADGYSKETAKFKKQIPEFRNMIKSAAKD